MAFGGLLDGFLDEKQFGHMRKYKAHMKPNLHHNKSFAGIDNRRPEQITKKKISSVSLITPSPKYSWPNVEPQPFCSPITPHVPIRQRLARRGTSVEMGDEPMSVAYSNNIYGPRRRRMSLLQTLRQQNKQLADSGLEINQRQRTDSESTNRDTCSPPMKASPPLSPSKKAFSNLKARLFGKRDKRAESQQSSNYTQNGEYSQSCDVINGRSRKSPSTTNDSGRGSQGHLEDRVIETIAIIERPDDEREEAARPYRRIRTSSCPDLSNLRISTSPRRAPLVESEEDDEGERNCSPTTAADLIMERRLIKKHLEMEARRKQSNHRDRAMMAMEPRGTLNEADEDADLHEMFHDRISRMSGVSRRSNQTEDLCDYDDNISTIVLDHYLPLSRSSGINYDEDDTLSSTFSISLQIPDIDSELEKSTSGTASSTVQTDLSLLNIEEEVTAYLTKLNEGEGNSISTEGMNFIAKHFFEYQSFVNMPHKAVQLHKIPPSQAGADPSMGWAPKNMNKAGKNQPAPASRANRIHRDPRPNGTKHGRAGKHEHRDWGDRHGELKDEKVAPHKDAWTKFLSNEDPGQRTVFECDFEDRVLATEDETLPERIARVSPDNMDFQMAYNANKSSSLDNFCELLTIITYAPTVQFVTVTIKRAKLLPFNNSPFARIMLFEGRRLMEQKQTTVDPSVGHKSSIETCSKPSSSSVSSSGSSSSGDAAFSESFLFHVSPSKLDKCHIVIEMFDHDGSNAARPVGHCVIGRSAGGTGEAHWFQMLRKHGLPVCMWHKIGSR